MTPEEYIKDKLQDLGKAVDDQIPVDYGFILLVFPFGPDGVTQYVANCNRGDALQLMREFIARTTETNYATDIGDQGMEPFEAWWKAQLQRRHDWVANTKTADLLDLRNWCYDAYMAGAIVPGEAKQ